MAGIIPPSTPGFDAARIRTKRVTTGSIAANATAMVVVTWGTPFADTAYTAVVVVLEGQLAATLKVEKIVAQTASSVTARVVNSDALTARTGTLHAIAIHDA